MLGVASGDRRCVGGPGAWRGASRSGVGHNACCIYWRSVMERAGETSQRAPKKQGGEEVWDRLPVSFTTQPAGKADLGWAEDCRDTPFRWDGWEVTPEQCLRSRDRASWEQQR